MISIDGANQDDNLYEMIYLAELSMIRRSETLSSRAMEWTPEEDAALMRTRVELSTAKLPLTRWQEVARLVTVATGGFVRTAEACRQRYETLSTAAETTRTKTQLPGGVEASEPLLAEMEKEEARGSGGNPTRSCSVIARTHQARVYRYEEPKTVTDVHDETILRVVAKTRADLSDAQHWTKVARRVCSATGDDVSQAWCVERYETLMRMSQVELWTRFGRNDRLRELLETARASFVKKKTSRKPAQRLEAVVSNAVHAMTPGPALEAPTRETVQLVQRDGKQISALEVSALTAASTRSGVAMHDIVDMERRNAMSESEEISFFEQDDGSESTLDASQVGTSVAVRCVGLTAGPIVTQSSGKKRPWRGYEEPKELAVEHDAIIVRAVAKMCHGVGEWCRWEQVARQLRTDTLADVPPKRCELRYHSLMKMCDEEVRARFGHDDQLRQLVMELKASDSKRDDVCTAARLENINAEQRFGELTQQNMDERTMQIELEPTLEQSSDAEATRSYSVEHEDDFPHVTQEQLQQEREAMEARHEERFAAFEAAAKRKQEVFAIELQGVYKVQFESLSNKMREELKRVKSTSEQSTKAAAECFQATAASILELRRHVASLRTELDQVRSDLKETEASVAAVKAVQASEAEGLSSIRAALDIQGSAIDLASKKLKQGIHAHKQADGRLHSRFDLFVVAESRKRDALASELHAHVGSHKASLSKEIGAIAEELKQIKRSNGQAQKAEAMICLSCAPDLLQLNEKVASLRADLSRSQADLETSKKDADAAKQLLESQSEALLRVKEALASQRENTAVEHDSQEKIRRAHADAQSRRYQRFANLVQEEAVHREAFASELRAQHEKWVATLVDDIDSVRREVNALVNESDAKEVREQERQGLFDEMMEMETRKREELAASAADNWDACRRRLEELANNVERHRLRGKQNETLLEETCVLFHEEIRREVGALGNAESRKVDKALHELQRELAENDGRHRQKVKKQQELIVSFQEDIRRELGALRETVSEQLSGHASQLKNFEEEQRATRQVGVDDLPTEVVVADQHQDELKRLVRDQFLHLTVQIRGLRDSMNSGLEKERRDRSEELTSLLQTIQQLLAI